jgi:hypothetical protein
MAILFFSGFPQFTSTFFANENNKSEYQSIQQSVIDLEGILKIGLLTVSFTSLITPS